MTRACAAALVVVLAAPVHAQDAAQYLALAREYAAGQGDHAIRMLYTWSPDAITAAAAGAAVTGSARDLVAAAMLHTDLANTIIDTRPEAGDFHLKKARGALTIASERVGQRERLEPIIRRWFRFTASVYTSCGLLPQAIEQVKLGLLRFPGDPQLHVAIGVIQEVRTRTALVVDWRRGVPFVARRLQNIELNLAGAVKSLLEALTADSHNAEAHLHLGWVRLFLEDKRARPELDAALADAQDNTIRYLAHLFLGGLAERQQRLADAQREYDEARALGSGHQTPYAALSRVEMALGHHDRARELATVAVQLHKTDDDPWMDFRIGFDRESLTWLRAEARTP